MTAETWTPCWGIRYSAITSDPLQNSIGTVALSGATSRDVQPHSMPLTGLDTVEAGLLAGLHALGKTWITNVHITHFQFVWCDRRSS